VPCGSRGLTSREGSTRCCAQRGQSSVPLSSVPVEQERLSRKVVKRSGCSPTGRACCHSRAECGVVLASSEPCTSAPGSRVAYPPLPYLSSDFRCRCRAAQSRLGRRRRSRRTLPSWRCLALQGSDAHWRDRGLRAFAVEHATKREITEISNDPLVERQTSSTPASVRSPRRRLHALTCRGSRPPSRGCSHARSPGC